MTIISTQSETIRQKEEDSTISPSSELTIQKVNDYIRKKV
jgi:hypothetical protein